jgi:hypothetical protein
MPTHLDNEQSIVAAAQAGDSDAFITLLNLEAAAPAPEKLNHK